MTIRRPWFQPSAGSWRRGAHPDPQGRVVLSDFIGTDIHPLRWNVSNEQVCELAIDICLGPVSSASCLTESLHWIQHGSSPIRKRSSHEEVPLDVLGSCAKLHRYVSVNVTVVNGEIIVSADFKADSEI